LISEGKSENGFIEAQRKKTIIFRVNRQNLNLEPQMAADRVQMGIVLQLK
jgi:hypothetical protein